MRIQVPLTQLFQLLMWAYFSSYADSDGSLSPGPSKAQSIPEYCSATYAEDSLSLASDDDTSLSETYAYVWIHI